MVLLFVNCLFYNKNKRMLCYGHLFMSIYYCEDKIFLSTFYFYVFFLTMITTPYSEKWEFNLNFTHLLLWSLKEWEDLKTLSQELQGYSSPSICIYFYDLSKNGRTLKLYHRNCRNIRALQYASTFVFSQRMGGP